MTTFVNVFDRMAAVALIARKCPSTTLRRAYVMALRDWCAQSQWLRQTVTGATVAGTSVYGLGSDPYLEIVGISAMSGTDNSGSTPQTFPINPGDSTLWNPNLSQAQPTQYQYLPEGQFALFQVPDKVYSLTVGIILQPKEDVTQIPAEPLKKYSTFFEAGALAYLLRLPGQPWTDLREADKYDRTFRSAINNAKAEVARSYNTGSVRVRPRAYVTGRG